MKSPEPFLQKYMWGCVPKTKLKSPYPENVRVNHPMDSDSVYKLIWLFKLSSTLSQMECEELICTLSKIKLLHSRYVKINILYLIINIIYVSNNKKLNFRINMCNYSSEECLEDLFCPLCNLNYESTISLNMHFNNHQHIERYQLAKNEILGSFKGPMSMIKHL